MNMVRDILPYFFFSHALALDGIRNVYIQEQIIFNQVIKNNKTYMYERRLKVILQLTCLHTYIPCDRCA